MTLEVRFLECTPNTFWQVVIGASDGPQADGDSDIASVLTMISRLTFYEADADVEDADRLASG